MRVLENTHEQNELKMLVDFDLDYIGQQLTEGNSVQELGVYLVHDTHRGRATFVQIYYWHC